MHIPAAAYPYHQHTKPVTPPQVTPLTYHHKHVYDPVIFLALTLLATTISLVIIAHCIKTMRAEIARIAESVLAEKQALRHLRAQESDTSNSADQRNGRESYSENVPPDAACEMEQG